MAKEREGPAQEEEELEEEVVDWVKEGIAGFLASPEMIRSQFESLARDYLSGRDIGPQLQRLLRLKGFFAVANLLRVPAHEFESTVEELKLDEEQVAQLRSLWSAVYPVLEDALDVAIDADVYGVTNTWTNLRAVPSYLPIHRQVMLDVWIKRGLDTVYSSTDKVEDFLGLAASLADKCRMAMEYAVKGGLQVDADQVTSLRRRVGRLEATLAALRGVLSQLAGEAPGEVPSPEEASESEAP